MSSHISTNICVRPSGRLAVLQKLTTVLYVSLRGQPQPGIVVKFLELT